MGGVPALLMVATFGVTYGWQPDGDQGVQYIIQIPPDQLAEIERMGSISSTIDPAVRGHVSKVIVKVGTESLPRTLPPAIAVSAPSADSLAYDDHRPMPIPESEMGVTAADVPNGVRELAMKPQNGANQNFALPPSLSDAGNTGSGMGAGAEAATATDLFNRGANALRSAAAGAISGAPNTARNDSASSQLQFADDPNLARPRIGGPSTEPVASRDSAWGNPSTRFAPSVDSNGLPPQVPPSNQAIGSATNPARIGDAYARPDTAGSRSTTEFAQLPSGMTLPGGYPPADATNNSNPSYRQSNSYDRVGSTGGGQSGLSSPPNPNQYENPFPAGRGETLPPSLTGGQPFSTRSSATNPQSATEPPMGDSPPGTWTFNAYGQPVDRQGRVLDAYGRPVDSSNSSPLASNPVQAGRVAAANQAPTNQGVTTLSPADRVDPRGRFAPAVTSVERPLPSSYSDAGPNRTSQYSDDRANSSADVGGMRGDGSRSSVPPRTLDSNAVNPISDRQTVTAQPLFNGMLLISIVANVYLIFWLKNLRHQFRDLVAAKRVAASNATSA